MRLIRQWLNRQKEKSREQRKKEIAETFVVKESGETLCIIHNGDAIHDFPVTATIEEVMESLWAHRNTALKHSGI